MLISTVSQQYHSLKYIFFSANWRALFSFKMRGVRPGYSRVKKEHFCIVQITVQLSYFEMRLKGVSCGFLNIRSVFISLVIYLIQINSSRICIAKNDSFSRLGKNLPYVMFPTSVLY